MSEFIVHKFKDKKVCYYMFMEKSGRAFAKGYTFNDDKKTFYMSELTVDPMYRRLGLGLKLQKLREQMAKKKGYKYTCLFVKKGSWMAKWYKRRGYKYYQKYKKKGFVWLRKKL